MYFVDGNYKDSSRLVLDHETYILNLTEANNHPEGFSPMFPNSPLNLLSPQSSHPDPNPKWTLLYRASQAYGMTSLFPSDWDGLIQTFLSDDRVFQRFWYLRYKGHVSEPCKETCKTSQICFLRSGRYDELEQCDLLNGFNGDMVRAVRKTLC